MSRVADRHFFNYLRQAWRLYGPPLPSQYCRVCHTTVMNVIGWELSIVVCGASQADMMAQSRAPEGQKRSCRSAAASAEGAERKFNRTSKASNPGTIGPVAFSRSSPIGAITLRPSCVARPAIFSPAERSRPDSPHRANNGSEASAVALPNDKRIDNAAMQRAWRVDPDMTSPRCDAISKVGGRRPRPVKWSGAAASPDRRQKIRERKMDRAKPIPPIPSGRAE